MIASVHQPLYLPWQPYFAKIASSDLFIFFDNVQYPGGTGFFNRNVIKGPTSPILLTAPVIGRKRLPLVKDIGLDLNQNWQASHWKTIQFNYKRAKYFNLYSVFLEEIYMKKKFTKLSDISIEIICKICNLLNFKTKFYLASELLGESRVGGENIIDLLKKVSANKYLSGLGEGSIRYMDEANYNNEGIKVFWHKYNPKPYKQLWGPHLENVCILDLLFNKGPDSLEFLMDNSSILSETI